MKKQVESKKRRSVERIPLYKDEPQTLAELFLQAAGKHNRADALNFKYRGKWKPISSDEMIERIENIALGLSSLGLVKGDTAAILAANSPEWTLTDAGCQFAGIIDVPIYTTLAPNSIEYILKDSTAKILFVDNKKSCDFVKEILPNCKKVETLIFFDKKDVSYKNAMSLEELEAAGAKLKAENPKLIRELTNTVTSQDIATLIYTSGTTGEPKGVMLSHENLISNVIDAGEQFEFSPDDKPLSLLPLSHVFERTGMYVNIFNGTAVHYAESIDKVAENMSEVKPTIFVGVPRIFEKVYAKAKLQAAADSPLKEKMFDWAMDTAKEYARLQERKESIPFALQAQHAVADKLVYAKMREFFGGNLRCCIAGGAALSKDIWLIFTGAGIPIMQGYGLTETSPVVTSNNPKHEKLGTVGKPIRNVEIRIAEDGEIEVSSPGMLMGYYNKPEATRDTFTDDGWFKTGDIGEIDNEGFLKLTDRKKELFKTSGGKYIAPSPIEEHIKSSRYVAQVVLVGNERKFPAALVVPDFDQLKGYAKTHNLKLNKPEDFCASEEIIELIQKQVDELTAELSKYEKVKKVALLPEELTVEGGELTPTLKIKRRVVDEKYAEVIEKIYADAENKKPAK